MAEIIVMKAVNAENELHAQKVRELVDHFGVLLINLLSSPGSGKTTLLEATLREWRGKFRMGAIEGDLFTDEDARRLERFGIQVVQLNTQGSCHLTANMIEKALEKLDLKALDFLFIENVGNLVCPASFNLGEHKRVTLLSVTEGQDKIKKYPKAFFTADLLLVSKIDLLHLTEVKLENLKEDFFRVNPKGGFLPLSAKTGDGMPQWLGFLEAWKKELL
ncbi:MAG: hydrogenase nickel incorporation protein HypB [Caldiserica bacterium]|jgi:hydrogenase nickel incorporation protein HypB|nr:hydrogenase nickel incorporation protein HypB [Caldisericota bacterium]MDH7562032.1 hydrogenase nickel incorporation protein HypB [Caldisericota bacterium]